MSFINKNRQRQWKIVGKLDFEIQKFVMSSAQSAITCTQEWNVVQYHLQDSCKQN